MLWVLNEMVLLSIQNICYNCQMGKKIFTILLVTIITCGNSHRKNVYKYILYKYILYKYILGLEATEPNLGLPTRSYANQPAQLQRLTRKLKFCL